jgi:hypothetical protein
VGKEKSKEGIIQYFKAAGNRNSLHSHPTELREDSIRPRETRRPSEHGIE